MKRFVGSLLVIGTLVVMGLPGVRAEAKVTASSSAQVNASVSKLNAQTNSSAKGEITTKALAAKYSVDASVITDLRSKGRGFGQINMILALASELQGGETASNIARVEGLRYGRTVKGWGQVAHELNVNLGSTVRKAEESRLKALQNIQAVAVLKADSDAQLRKSIAELNAQTSDSAKAEIATKALAAKYSVDASVITNLRNKGQGFGEINILLSLASELPGGVTASNITRVDGLRHGATVKGWGQVAHQLNLDMGSAVRHAEENRLMIHQRIQLGH